jgi:hypothetical protein
MRYVKAMEAPKRTPKSHEMKVEDGCSLCGGPVSVRFSRSRAVTVCQACRHIAVALVHLEGGNVIFEQIVHAAA